MARTGGGHRQTRAVIVSLAVAYGSARKIVAFGACTSALRTGARSTASTRPTDLRVCGRPSFSAQSEH